MGYGDVKVGYICGTIVGLSGVLPMLVATFVIGGLVAGLALLLRLRGRNDIAAFTPFLLGGTLFALLAVAGSVYLPAP
jgi:prepilin signal peptidase PulO-like enzyme (type II secretory pathway)